MHDEMRPPQYEAGDKVTIIHGYFTGCPAVVKGAGLGTVSVVVSDVAWEGMPSYHLNNKQVKPR